MLLLLLSLLTFSRFCINAAKIDIGCDGIQDEMTMVVSYVDKSGIYHVDKKTICGNAPELLIEGTLLSAVPQSFYPISIDDAEENIFDSLQNAVDSNTEAISKNGKDVSTMQETITKNSEQISQNAATISSNKNAISKNVEEISSNGKQISTNGARIADLDTSVKHNSAQIKAHTDAIATLNHHLSEMNATLRKQVANELTDFQTQINEEMRRMNTTVSHQLKNLAIQVSEEMTKQNKIIFQLASSLEDDMQEFNRNMTAALAQVYKAESNMTQYLNKVVSLADELDKEISRIATEVEMQQRILDLLNVAKWTAVIVGILTSVLIILKIAVAVKRFRLAKRKAQPLLVQ